MSLFRPFTYIPRRSYAIVVKSNTNAKGNVKPEAGSSFKKEVDRMPTPQALLQRVTVEKPNLPIIYSSGILPITGRVYSPSPVIENILKEATKIPKHLSELFKLLGTPAFLWREDFNGIISEMNSSEKIRLLIDGPPGVGKSVTLMQILESLINNRKEGVDHIVMYFPRTSRWIAGYYPYFPSSSGKGSFDQPALAIEIMEMAVLLNPILKQNPNLSFLCSEAKESPTLKAIENFTKFMNDPRLQGGKTVIIDEANSLYAPTAYRDMESKPIKVEQLTVPLMVRNLCNDSNTKLVAAYCRSNPALLDSTLNSNIFKSSLKKIDYFTSQDILSLLKHYKDLGHVFQEVDSRYAKKIQFLSGGCGNKILPAIDFDTVYAAKRNRRIH